MTKFIYTGPAADYPTLGFSVSGTGAILDGTLSTPTLASPPDARWAVYGGGNAETGVTRYGSSAGATPTAEPADGYVLAYSDADNAYVPVDPSTLSGAAAPEGAFTVFATDDESVADAYPEFAWVILAPPDTTAPTVPTGLSATPGDTQVVLDWTDSTDAVGVTGYRVYRGGTLIASPTASTYTDTGRTNGVLLSYTVSAIDAAGNESAQTSAVTATPAAAVTVIASDDFTRANSLSLGSTPVGSKAWTKTGAAGGTAGFDNTGISGNQMQVVGNTASAFTCVHVDSGVANHDVSAKLYIGNAGDKMGLINRYIDNDNVLRLVIYTTGWDLTNVVGGVLNSVVGFTGRTIATGDTWRMRIVGNTYTVWHAGVQISTGSVTTASTSATKCGVTGAGTNFTGFADDFSVSSA